jgi:hypothetical protein
VACWTLLAMIVAWNVSVISWIRYFRGAPMAPLGVPLAEVKKVLAGDAPPTESGPPVNRAPGAWLQACYAYVNFAGPLIQAIRLDQRWDMFSHPPDADYRFVAKAQLRDGSEVDVLRGGAAVDVSDLEGLAPAEPNVRWMLLYMGLTGEQFSWFSQDVAEYLRRQWDAAHDEPRRVQNLELLLLQHVPRGGGRFEQRQLVEIGPRPGYRIVHDAGGAKIAEGPQHYGARHGRWKVWEVDDGVRYRREGEYVMGVAEGWWTYWYENGQKESEGRLVHGERVGPWTYWYDNGAKLEEGSYQAELRDGEWASWRDGEWTYWNRDGSLSGKATYKDGMLDGQQVFYEADGTVRIQRFRDGEPVDFEL